MPERDDCDPVQDRKAAREAGVLDIPGEPLSATLEYRGLIRRQERLHLASRFFAAAITGRGDLCRRAPAELRAWCWDQADLFLAEGDKPATPTRPTPPASDPVQDQHNQRAYLEWLRGRDGSCLVTEQPTALYPSEAAAVRRHLLKSGLIAATHKGGAMEATGYVLTAAGWGHLTATAAEQAEPGNHDPAARG